MWLRPLIVVDDPRVDAARAGRSMVTKPCVGGSIPAGGTDQNVWFRLIRDTSAPGAA